MRVALIGAGGFFGPYLTRALETAQHTVIPVRSGSGGIDPVTGRFAQPLRLPEGTDAVVYLAQSPRYREGLAALDHLVAVNVLSAADAAAEAQRVGAKIFAYFSTGNVYAPSFATLSENDRVEASSPYAASKLWGEQAVKLAAGAMPTLILRPFGIFGPGQRGMLVANVADRVRRGEPVALASRVDRPDTDGLRTTPCYAPDGARAVVALLQKGEGGIVNLAGPELLSLRALADAAGKKFQRSPQFTAAAAPRTFDLVANPRKLAELQLPITPLSQALDETFEAQS